MQLSTFKKIYLAGHRGMVGSAIMRALKQRQEKGDEFEIVVRTRPELDLTKQDAVNDFLAEVKPDAVILAAARVGGIHANNSLPAEFIYENLAIELNVVHGAFLAGTKHLMSLGSSCIYPKLSPQPIRESFLLSGLLEPTNEPYAIAKIAGIKLCESYNRQHGTDFRCAMPTNLYGPGDNFHPTLSHVVPGLIQRFHKASRAGAAKVAIWGSGTPRREFLYVNDLADAVVHLLDLPSHVYWSRVSPSQSHINIGTGSDISIRELAKLIAAATGFVGEIETDASKPDGTPQKLLDVSLLTSMGWRSKTSLEDGIKETYAWYLAEMARGSLRT
jgi:GDP-L-fucose synthase